VLESSERGQVQTAYQIHVAATPEYLHRTVAICGLGESRSSEQNQIAYGGAPLKSHQPCFWSVRVWDKDGKPSPWSLPHADDGFRTARRLESIVICVPTSDLRCPYSVATSGRKTDPARIVVCLRPGFQRCGLNGRKVGEDEYAPGWTNYRKTCSTRRTTLRLQSRMTTHWV